MFNYKKHPLNAWIYGVSMLVILVLPLIVFLVELASKTPASLGNSGDFLHAYLSVMLYPMGFSSEYLFQIPYLGAILMIGSFVLHLHVYCTLIERIFTLFNHRFLSRTSKS